MFIFAIEHCNKPNNNFNFKQSQRKIDQQYMYI